MYHYDRIDQQLINERAAQHRDQIERNLAGQLSDAPRLRRQKHAPA